LFDDEQQGVKMKIFYAWIVATSVGLAAAQGGAATEKIGVMSTTPSPSPAGTEVVFSADFDGEFRIWAADVNGSRLRKLSTTLSNAESTAHLEPAWSPDGRYIAYTSEAGATTDIWVMQTDGGHAIRLTSSSGKNNQPAWSPDGAKIAFISDRAGTRDVWLMNPDGSQQQRLTTSPGEENNPHFAPSGDRVVFSETANGSASIRVINRDGSGLRSLTANGFYDFEPHWGAPGIAFSSNRDGSGRWKIWVVQPDGSGLRKLPDATGHDPRWMRDGRILFTDEPTSSRALAAVSVLDPQSGRKQIVVDVQGYEARVDIRPNRRENQVNPRSRGKLEVAVLSTATFDATKVVDQQTLTFGRTGSEASLSSCSKASRDLNGDGIPDLLCRFQTSAAAFNATSSSGVLRFLDTKGRPYEGRDTIVIVPHEDPSDLRD
jgi:Tol biopolymer transport system component